ncbi:MAG: hypothetical protein NTY48_04395, partial [Candidatus Diapherotrites archaeon]|nr:hypothetical protein [Candidatus Diapherotrites archaeon]
MFELNRKNKERLANLPAPKNKEIFETFLYKHYKVNYTHPHGHEEVSSVHVNIVADCCLEFLAFLKKPLPEYTTDEL